MRITIGMIMIWKMEQLEKTEKVDWIRERLEPPTPRLPKIKRSSRRLKLSRDNSRCFKKFNYCFINSRKIRL